MTLYQVATSHSSESLEAAVALLLKDGWKLEGGVSVAMSFSPCYETSKGASGGDQCFSFAQALSKEELCYASMLTHDGGES